MISIIDYGAGNLQSVEKALRHIGCDCQVTADPAALLAWVDVLYTEEGAIAALAGTEGEDYVVGEDGSWTWKGGMEAKSS